MIAVASLTKVYCSARPLTNILSVMLEGENPMCGFKSIGAYRWCFCWRFNLVSLSLICVCFLRCSLVRLLAFYLRDTVCSFVAVLENSVFSMG